MLAVRAIKSDTRPDERLDVPLLVEEARARIVGAMRRLESESVDLRSALGRITAEDVPARRDHPSTAVSAMDGYALRSADIVQLPVRLPGR
jgi:molybdopterin molybdotransferase